MGATDPKTGHVIPIQTCRTRPNFATVLYPVTRYSICYGHLEPGSVMKGSEMGRVLCLDFTGSSLNYITFTLDEHDEYEIDPVLAESNFVWKTEMLES